eukprot:scaffold11395_cov95-Skeletonema_dohrnii-CCMP3373.AAC.2
MCSCKHSTCASRTLSEKEEESRGKATQVGGKGVEVDEETNRCTAYAQTGCTIREQINGRCLERTETGLDRYINEKKLRIYAAASTAMFEPATLVEDDESGKVV